MYDGNGRLEITKSESKDEKGKQKTCRRWKDELKKSF
jgi:hypothetical protein